MNSVEQAIDERLAALSGAELLEYAGSLCKQLYDKGKEYPPWSKERGQWWVRSLVLFVEIFIGPDLPIPDFHHDWYFWRCSEKSYLNMAPRDHAKTTVHAVNSVVWELCIDRNLTFFLVFATEPIGTLILKQIKNHLTKNKKITDVFGIFNPSDLPPEERMVDLDWSQTSITVNRDSLSIKDPSVAIAGAGTNVLSRRCKRLIADDLVSDKVAYSEAESERLYRWYYNDVYPTLESDGQEIITGTLYKRGDFYHQVMEQSIEKGGAYRVYIGDAIVDEVNEISLWPERWSYEGLMYQKAKIGAVRFNRNYRNRVLDEADSPFPMLWFEGGVDERGVYFPGCYDHDIILGAGLVDGWLRMTAIGVDPALSQKKASFTAKYFALVVLGIDYQGRIIVCDMIRERCNSITQKRHVVNMFLKWKARYIAVESNAYQRALAEGIEDQYPNLPIYTWHTSGQALARKPELGVAGMDVYIERGQFRFPRGNHKSVIKTDQLIEELHYWGAAKTSDLAMATWFAFAMLKPEIDKLTPLPDPKKLGFGGRPEHIMGLAGRPLPRVMAKSVRDMAVRGPLAHMSPLGRGAALASPKEIMKTIRLKAQAEKEKENAR